MKKTLLGIFIVAVVFCLVPVLYTQAQVGPIDPGIEIEIKIPVLSEITSVPTPTGNNTPEYTFSSTAAGRITYEGPCSSPTTNAIVGNNTITFNSLSDGTYNGCRIRVTDRNSSASLWLQVTPFTVDTTPENPTPTSTFQVKWERAQTKYTKSSDSVIKSADKLIGKINAISSTTLSQVTGLIFFISDIEGQKTSIDLFKTSLLAEVAPPTEDAYDARIDALKTSIRGFKTDLKNSNTKFSWLKTTNNLFKYADRAKTKVETALSKGQIASSTRDSLINAYDAEKPLINQYINTIPEINISTTTKAAFKNQVKTFKNNLKNINKRFSLERSTITKLDLKLNAPVVGDDAKKWGIRSMFNIVSQDNYCTNTSEVASLITTLTTRLNERQAQLETIRGLATAYTFTDIRTQVGTMKIELKTDYAKLLELVETCVHPED